MNLFFYIPNDPNRLYSWYIIEVVIILINYILCIIWIVMTPKLRVHIHLKVSSPKLDPISFQMYTTFVYVSFILFLTVRIIVLAYFNEYIQVAKDTPLENNPVIIFCALGRMFYPAVIVTM